MRLALGLKGIDYEHVDVSLAPGEAEQRADTYRELNPQMLGPFFDDGKVATGQSMAILEYLEEAYLDIGAQQGFTDQQAFLGYYGGIIDPVDETDDNNGKE